MYDDRLEIYSPGGLVDGGTIKDADVLNMASRRRNPILADIFSRLKYMERRGSGFKKIVSAYREHEGYTEDMAPSFSTPRDSFVLTLPKFNVIGVEGVYVSNVDDTEVSHNAGGQKGGQKGGQNDTGKTIDTILQLIKENPSITRKVLAETVGISPSAIQKHINHLKNEGLIIRNGGDRDGYWEINNAGGQKGGQKGGQNDTGKTIDTILQLIKENPSITRKVLAETVGISPSAIQKHINHLKNEGLIIRNGGDRDGYWEIKKVSDKKTNRIYLSYNGPYSQEPLQRLGRHVQRQQTTYVRLLVHHQFRRVGQDGTGTFYTNMGVNKSTLTRH